jgi:hypothetical protein
MSYLARKMKLAKKSGGGGWTSSGVRNSKDKCPGCDKRFKDMSTTVFDKHVQNAIDGRGCPFPRKD